MNTFNPLAYCVSNIDECFPIDLRNNLGKRFQSVIGCLRTRMLPLFCKGRVRPRTVKNTPPIINQGGGSVMLLLWAHTGKFVVVHKFTSAVLKFKLVFGPF